MKARTLDKPVDTMAKDRQLSSKAGSNVKSGPKDTGTENKTSTPKPNFSLDFNENSIFNNPGAHHARDFQSVDDRTSGSHDDNTNSTNKNGKRARDATGTAKKRNEDKKEESSPQAKRIQSSTGSPRLAPDAFMKRVLRISQTLTTPTKSGISPVRSPSAPNKKANPKTSTTSSPSQKATCRSCAKLGLECTPHAKYPEKYRCNMCMGARMNKEDCIMIDATEAAAIAKTRRPAKPTTITPVKKGALTSSKQELRDEEADTLEMATPTPAPKTLHTVHPTPAITPAQSSVTQDTQNATPTPMSSGSNQIAINPPVHDSDAIDEIAAFFQTHHNSPNHDLRAMGHLLWATQTELRHQVETNQTVRQQYQESQCRSHVLLRDHKKLEQECDEKNRALQDSRREVRDLKARDQGLEDREQMARRRQQRQDLWKGLREICDGKKTRRSWVEVGRILELAENEELED